MIDGAVPNYRKVECCATCEFCIDSSDGYEPSQYECRKVPYRNARSSGYENTEPGMVCDLWEEVR